MRIHDRIATKRARMNSRRVTTGVGIVGHPGVTIDVLLQDEDVPMSCSNHARCRRCPGKAKPVRCEIQFRHDPAEHAQGRAAATEGPRTAGRTTADDLRACNSHLRHVAPTDFDATPYRVTAPLRPLR